MRSFCKRLFDLDAKNLETQAQIFEIKSFIMDNLMLEERVYTESLTDFIGGRGLNFASTRNLTTNPGEQSFRGKNSQPTHSSKLSKIKVDSSSQYFGLFRVVTGLLVAITLLVLVQLAHYFILRPRESRTASLVKIWAIASEFWCSFVSMNVFFVETILFNNTGIGWHNKSTLETYTIIKDNLQRNVLDNITESLTYDLGNFTDKWRSTMTQGNSCETVFNFVDKLHYHCGDYYSGLLTNNLQSSLSALLSVTKQLLDDYEQFRTTFEGQKQFFKDSRFETIITKLPDQATSLYYWMTVDSSNLMMKSIDSDQEVLNLAYYFFQLLVILATLVALNVTGKKVSGSLRDFETLVLTLPIKVIEKNLELVHHLKRVRKGARLW